MIICMYTSVFSEGADQIRSDQIPLLGISMMRQQVNEGFYVVAVNSGYNDFQTFL